MIIITVAILNAQRASVAVARVDDRPEMRAAYHLHLHLHYATLLHYVSSHSLPSTLCYIAISILEEDIYQEPGTTFTGCLLIQANLMNHSRKDKEKFLIDGMGNDLPRCKEVKRLAQIWL